MGDVIKGFDKHSASRINAAANRLERAKNQSTIPPQMMQAFDVLIQMALMGQVGQVEICVGKNAEEAKKVRIVFLPSDLGEVIVTEEGKKMRCIVVPDELGAIKEVSKP